MSPALRRPSAPVFGVASLSRVIAGLRVIERVLVSVAAAFGSPGTAETPVAFAVLTT